MEQEEEEEVKDTAKKCEWMALSWKKSKNCNPIKILFTLTPFLFTIIPPNLIQLLKNEIFFSYPKRINAFRYWAWNRSKALIRQATKTHRKFIFQRDFWNAIVLQRILLCKAILRKSQFHEWRTRRGINNGRKKTHKLTARCCT